MSTTFTAPTLPLLTISDAEAIEGADGQTTALRFTIRLSEASDQRVFFSFATRDGTASAASGDYAARSGGTFLEVGQTERVMTVQVRGDGLIEPDETMFLDILSVRGAVLADGRGVGTIRTDDHVVPTLTVSDAEAREWNAGTRPLVFVARLSEPTTREVSFAFSSADGTATIAEGDYSARSGRVTFLPGETEKEVRIVLRGDRLAEGDETIALTLSDARGLVIDKPFAIGTIRDDDPAPPQPPPAGDALALSVTNAWSGGFTAEGVVVNDASPMSGWTVAFDAPLTITNVWNAVLVSQEGGRVVIANAPWNGAVGGNGSVSFGFQASGAASLPATAVLNGVAVGTSGETGPTPPPALSVGDATLREGDAGASDMAFTLRLSAPSGEVVRVHVATDDVTATAGADYAARQLVVEFAPGQTEAVVRIPVLGDAIEEAAERFALTVLSAKGATVADGVGIGTILDDDAPAPAIGFLRAEGNQIVDAEGTPVRITGVNWFGMETETHIPHGMAFRSYTEHMDAMKDAGFNAIRLPFSLASLEEGRTPGWIDYGLNPELAGLTPLQILDRIVEYAGEIGMRILLDCHRSAPGPGPNPNGLWFDGGYTEADWIEAWEMLAARYAGNPTVIGADLHNEPHGATWNAWAAAAERAGNAILAVNPDWLIVVEGVGVAGGENYWWGGNLREADDRPITLDIEGRLVYSPHDYGNSVFPQPWFSAGNFPANLPALFDETWGYLFRQEIAPILLGEFGSKLEDPKDLPWLQTLLAYLSGDFDANGVNDLPDGQLGMSWMWWSWNPNSGDTGGILSNDWITPIQAKLDLLAPHMGDALI
jgi:chitinase